MLFQKYEVYRVTEYKDDAVYKTDKIGAMWLRADVTVTRKVGDLIFQPTVHPLTNKIPV